MHHHRHHCTATGERRKINYFLMRYFLASIEIKGKKENYCYLLMKNLMMMM